MVRLPGEGQEGEAWQPPLWTPPCRQMGLAAPLATPRIRLCWPFVRSLSFLSPDAAQIFGRAAAIIFDACGITGAIHALVSRT